MKWIIFLLVLFYEISNKIQLLKPDNFVLTKGGGIDKLYYRNFFSFLWITS